MKTLSWEARVRLSVSDKDMHDAIELLQKSGDLPDDVVDMIQEQALECCASRLMMEMEGDN